MSTRKRAFYPASPAQFPVQHPGHGSHDARDDLHVADLDGACLHLNELGLGLALVVDADGRALDIVECAEAVPYRLSVEHGVSESTIDPRGWVS